MKDKFKWKRKLKEIAKRFCPHENPNDQIANGGDGAEGGRVDKEYFATFADHHFRNAARDPSERKGQINGDNGAHTKELSITNL